MSNKKKLNITTVLNTIRKSVVKAFSMKTSLPDDHDYFYTDLKHENGEGTDI